MNIWTEEQKQHIEDIADENCVDHDTAFMLADLLGESELYDGFITSMEDAGEDY